MIKRVYTFKFKIIATNETACGTVSCNSFFADADKVYSSAVEKCMHVLGALDKNQLQCEFFNRIQ